MLEVKQDVLVCMSLLAGSYGMRCLSCDNVPQVADCFRQEAKCEDGQEECYLTKLMLPDMTIVYKAGCQAQKVCEYNENQIGNGKRKRQLEWEQGRMKDYLLCDECCIKAPDKDGIPCNGHLCGQHPNISTTHVWCATCDNIADPSLCSTYTQCPQNEVCIQEQVISGGRLVYNLGCQRKEICDRLLYEYKATHSKREHGDIQICSGCCGTRDCNQGNCNSIRQSQQYFDQAKG